MLGVQSIGLVVWIFFLVVFIVGCGMFIAGAVGFGVTTATHRKKCFRIIFAVIAVIGIVMIVIPALQFHYLRQANGADHENCVETDYNTQYRYEWVNGTEHMGFTEDCVFSPKDKLLKAQAFYSDLSHYDFYKSTVDDDIGEGSPVDISDEVLKIMDLTISETVNDVKGRDADVCMVSKDGLFAGYLYFKIKGDRAYIYIDLSGGEDDEDEEEYLRIPDDIARTLIPKLRK